MNPRADELEVPVSVTPSDGQRLRVSLAENLRRARGDRGWSLRELAARSEVSKALLSRIERGDGNPSIETLFRIAAALACPVSELIAIEVAARTEVIRADEGRSVVSERGQALSRLIFASSGHDHIEIFEFTMEPNTSTEWEGHPAHRVTEFAVVESGSVMVGPDGEESLLGRGDAISFRHGARNSYRSFDEDARLVCVVAYDR
jgi:transcriptional regulator with XRE-family HTH domain